LLNVLINKLIINITAFLSAVVLAVFAFLFFKSNIINHYPSLSPLQQSIKKTYSLQNDLETGKIILFGSSELTNHGHTFIPENFFNKTLKVPLTSNGHAGHQSFAILSQLASLSNQKVKDNARVIIFLSPGWFESSYAKGTSVPSFLEYMYSGMMYKLYYESDVNRYYKFLIGQYIKKNIKEIKSPSDIYKYAANYVETTDEFSLKHFFTQKIVKNIYTSDLSTNKVLYQKQNLDYAQLREEAQKVAKPSTNNTFGINNEYYTKYVEPNIKKGTFPYAISVPSIKENQEYKDFLNLVKLLKDYKIKPLFIMQDQNPFAYAKNRGSLEPILANIKAELNKYGYGYLDMWTYDKKNYILGTLTDIMHTGELGWVEIDKKIIEHFMPEDNK